MTPEEFKKQAKAHNAQIKKQLKILQGGITEGKNKNKWLEKELKKLQAKIR